MLEAAGEGNTTDVSALLALGADVNKVVHEPWGLSQYKEKTALSVASDNLHPEVVKLLLAASANVNTKVRNGETALYLACSPRNRKKGSVEQADIASQQIEVVKLLLAANADVNAEDDFHKTVLREACGVYSTSSAGTIRQAIEVVRLLVAANVNVNAKDDWDSTALSEASGCVEIQKLLRDAGASEPHVLSSRAQLLRSAVSAFDDGDLPAAAMILEKSDIPIDRENAANCRNLASTGDPRMIQTLGHLLRQHLETAKMSKN